MAGSTKKDLLMLKTDKFKFYMRGKPYHPLLGKSYYEDLGADEESREGSEDNNKKAWASIKAGCYKGCQLQEVTYFHPDRGFINVEEFEDNRLEISLPPLFFEEQDYEITIRIHEEGNSFNFFHENPLLRDEVRPLPDDDSVLTGSINFGSDVGYSHLEIREDKKRPLLDLRIEVFPAKLDYRQDYHRLLKEVNDEIYNLAYDFLRRTFQEMRLRDEDEGKPDPSEFFSILEQIMERFRRAFRRLMRSPHHRFQKRTRVLPAGRVKNVSRESLKWIRRNPEHFDRERGRPEKVLNIEKQFSYDTFENRFVRWMIERIKEQLNIFLEKHRQVYGEDKYITGRIKGFERDFDRMLERTFLSQVGKLKQMQSLSLVLQMAPGYREIYKYYLMLKRGLAFKGKIYQLSMKELSRLYEYWCFLKLEKILREEYDLKRQNLVAIGHDGLNVKLERRGRAEAKFENPKTGETFSLQYNTSQGSKITTGQRPDNILELKKEGRARHGKKPGEVKYKFVFDAKYRLEKVETDGEDSEENEAEFEEKSFEDDGKMRGGDYLLGPPRDSINTMHRYRDAIIAEEQSRIAEETKEMNGAYENSGGEGRCRRPVVGAFVLFPCPEEKKYKEEHDFYKSISRVNVGAFPFMPGSTKLVRQFLKNIVEESFFSGFERNILPVGKRQYLDRQEFDRNMLVGSLRGPEQLDFILDDNSPTFYHIPCRQIKLHEHNLKYLAVYQSRRQFGENCGIKYYWRIDDIKVKERRKIPAGKSSSAEPYYVINLRDRGVRDKPIKPMGYGLSLSHIYCNYDLFRRAEVLPDLHIKSWRGWRIWLELKRMRDDIKVEMEESGTFIIAGEEIEGFVSGDIYVQVQDDNVVIENYESEDSSQDNYPLDEFVHNLRGVFKEI